MLGFFASRRARPVKSLSCRCTLTSQTGSQTRPRGIGKAPVFPELAGKHIAGRRGLSVQFRDIATKAGITGRVVTREGKGRATNSKTFHALRHTFVSSLANAGVAPDIRQKLAGHSSTEP